MGDTRCGGFDGPRGPWHLGAVCVCYLILRPRGCGATAVRQRSVTTSCFVSSRSGGRGYFVAVCRLEVTQVEDGHAENERLRSIAVDE